MRDSFVSARSLIHDGRGLTPIIPILMSNVDSLVVRPRAADAACCSCGARHAADKLRLTGQAWHMMSTLRVRYTPTGKATEVHEFHQCCCRPLCGAGEVGSAGKHRSSRGHISARAAACCAVDPEHHVVHGRPRLIGSYVVKQTSASIGSHGGTGVAVVYYPWAVSCR